MFGRSYDPLLTPSVCYFPGNDNERARHIRLHERVNGLPDPNYSTLKYLMGHLHKCVTTPIHDLTSELTHLFTLPQSINRVVQHEAQNQMSVQNLAIVFGPSLFGQGQPGLNGAINGMADASLQNKVRENVGAA